MQYPFTRQKLSNGTPYSTAGLCAELPRNALKGPDLFSKVMKKLKMKVAVGGSSSTQESKFDGIDFSGLFDEAGEAAVTQGALAEETQGAAVPMTQGVEI
jgi:hypothetical protein